MSCRKTYGGQHSAQYLFNLYTHLGAEHGLLHDDDDEEGTIDDEAADFGLAYLFSRAEEEAELKAKEPKSHFEQLKSEQQNSVLTTTFLNFPPETRNQIYTILLAEICTQPMRFLAKNKWPEGCVTVQLGGHNATEAVLPQRPLIHGGLLSTCKQINREYMGMLSKRADITIVIPDLIHRADADLATAYAPPLRDIASLNGQLYVPPKFLHLSSFRPQHIRKLTIHLLLPTVIPETETELYWNTRLIDGQFLKEMLSLRTLHVILTYNASNPDRYSISEWLQCQAVRLAVASIVENTDARIHWAYDVIHPDARDAAKKVRIAMRKVKREGFAGHEKRKLMGRICNLWTLLDHGTFFRVQRNNMASKRLGALAVEMKNLAIGGYKKGGRYGQ